jgi:uncharacterized membrane protein
MKHGASSRSGRGSAQLAYVQGVYFFVFGLWPLIDIRSFQMVTGPKSDHLATGLEADHWLVFTVGLQLAAIGAVLLIAAWDRSVNRSIALLGLLSAASLALIDLIYVCRGTISSIYLLDAVAEMLFVAGWSIVLIATARISNVELEG